MFVKLWVWSNASRTAPQRVGGRSRTPFGRVALLGLVLGSTWGCGGRSNLSHADHDGGLLVLPGEVLDAGSPPNQIILDSAPPPEEPEFEPPPEMEPEEEPQPPAQILPPIAPDMPPVMEPMVVMEPEEEQEPPLPEECVLAPVEPELSSESFELLADAVTQDYLPPADERWEWAGDEADATWPYPSRAIWPTPVELPAGLGQDVELVALAGASADDLYVVGQSDDAALVLHNAGGEWQNESQAVLGVLPSASGANSVSVVSPEQVWVTTPEGLLRSDGAGQWQLVDAPAAVFPLGAVWMNESGFGVLAGGSVATTFDAGKSWNLETRDLGFVAPGLAYSRSFVRVAGHGNQAAVVGRFGHLITRSDDGWQASTVLASDVAFTDGGQFMTSRNASQGLFMQTTPAAWQIYPLSGSGGLDRVWASPSGEVFAGGDMNAILHRFADGSLELLPSEASDIVDFYADGGSLYSLSEGGLWHHELGDVSSSSASRAALLDEELLDIAPGPSSTWGRSAAPNFEPLECVDDVISVGAPAWQGQLEPNPPQERYGTCYGAQRQFSETAFSFTAPSAGTYRLVLEQAAPEAEADEGVLQLALRNGCEGWLIWNGGFVGTLPAVDIGLDAGQVLLVEVWAEQEISQPLDFRLSIY